MQLKENLKIENIQHPEWGTFRVINKYDNRIWEIRGDAGDRILFENEINFWREI